MLTERAQNLGEMLPEAAKIKSTARLSYVRVKPAGVNATGWGEQSETFTFTQATGSLIRRASSALVLVLVCFLNGAFRGHWGRKKMWEWCLTLRVKLWFLIGNILLLIVLCQYVFFPRFRIKGTFPLNLSILPTLPCVWSNALMKPNRSPRNVQVCWFSTIALAAVYIFGGWVVTSSMWKRRWPTKWCWDTVY